MFGKSSAQQQRPLNLTAEEMTEDIEAVRLNEYQRSKLYAALDQNPPHNHQFSKVEEFLKGTNNLEEVQEKLDCLDNEVEELMREVDSKVDKIMKSVVGGVGSKNNSVY